MFQWFSSLNLASRRILERQNLSLLGANFYLYKNGGDSILAVLAKNMLQISARRRSSALLADFRLWEVAGNLSGLFEATLRSITCLDLPVAPRGTNAWGRQIAERIAEAFANHRLAPPHLKVWWPVIVCPERALEALPARVFQDANLDSVVEEIYYPATSQAGLVAIPSMALPVLASQELVKMGATLSIGIPGWFVPELDSHSASPRLAAWLLRGTSTWSLSGPRVKIKARECQLPTFFQQSATETSVDGLPDDDASESDDATGMGLIIPPSPE